MIKHDLGKHVTVPVWKEPNCDDKKKRKKCGKSLALYESIDLLEEVKGDAAGPYWRIGKGMFVQAKYVARDATWVRYSRLGRNGTVSKLNRQGHFFLSFFFSLPFFCFFSLYLFPLL